MESINEILQIRRDKLTKLREAGRDPFLKDSFDRTHFSVQVIENFDNLEGSTVSLAGRIMQKRDMGKASFINIQDSEGRIQVYVRKDMIGDDYDVFKTYDIGDIVGVTGLVFKTQKEEISIKASSVELLTKSLQILPEKWHGLKDIEIRYRQRYLDLIVNPEVKDSFIKRTKIIKTMKDYFDSENFLEVDTPVLSSIAGGATARPFITHHNTLDINMYMRIANELYLKRLIVGGFDRVYEMGKMFRNEGISIKHNPEYTAVELYAAYTNYEYMMTLTEQSVSRACMAVNGSMKSIYDGTELDFTPPWRRVSMHDLVKDKTGIDFWAIPTDEEARNIARAKLNMEIKDSDTRGHLINNAFEEYCEADLVQPTFVLHHPVAVSPLSKRNKENPEYTDRFEAFAYGMEIANGFSELNDAIDQKQRFEAQLKEREEGNEEAHMMDTDFINALEVGMPPTGGLGIGVDRTIMLLTGNTSIRDIILFPTMKPLANEKNNSDHATASASNSSVGTSQSHLLGGSANSSEKVQGNTSCCSGNDEVITHTQEVQIDFTGVEIEPLFADMVDFETFSKSDFRAVKVLECEVVPKSKKLLKFTLDDGSGTNRTILSGIREYYEPEKLIGKTCVAITNLPPRPMMGMESCGMLISAVHKQNGEEKLNLLMLDNKIPAGAKLY